MSEDNEEGAELAREKPWELLTACTAGGAEPPKPFGVHNVPHMAGDAGRGAVGFRVCPAALWSCFGPVALSPLPCTLEMGMSVCCHGGLEVFDFASVQKLAAKSLP